MSLTYEPASEVCTLTGHCIAPEVLLTCLEISCAIDRQIRTLGHTCMGSCICTINEGDLEVDPVCPVSGHGSGDVNSVAISRDGKLVASGSDDGTVKIWNAETWAEVSRFAGELQGWRGEGGVWKQLRAWLLFEVV